MYHEHHPPQHTEFSFMVHLDGTEKVDIVCLI